MIFNTSQIHHILDEIVMGGMVLETNSAKIVNEVEKSDVALRDVTTKGLNASV